MATSELATLDGIDTILLARKKSEQATASGQIIPYQTSLSFDPSRDTNTNATKDGTVSSKSSVSTDLEVEFINNTSAIADAMYDSLFDGDVMDAWIVYRNRRNSDGKYFAWYMQVTVSEDSNDNDPDDNSTRDVTFSVNGTPKRGWVELDADTQETLDYVFKGTGVVTDKDATGGGTAWTSSDAGVNVAQSEATSSADPASSSDPADEDNPASSADPASTTE